MAAAYATNEEAAENPERLPIRTILQVLGKSFRTCQAIDVNVGLLPNAIYKLLSKISRMKPAIYFLSRTNDK